MRPLAPPAGRPPLVNRRRRRTPNPLPYRVGVVEWVDAHGDSGWLSPDEIDPTPVKVTSVAFVVGVHVKPDHLTICQDVHPDGRLNGVSHIPLGMAPTIHFLT